ncbi:hypothetical protein M8J77_006934 [Diaphorina citri]|nr:hypothetical protein M8J77_006934 [Diaphorina citri]
MKMGVSKVVACGSICRTRKMIVRIEAVRMSAGNITGTGIIRTGTALMRTRSAPAGLALRTARRSRRAASPVWRPGLVQPRLG